MAKPEVSDLTLDFYEALGSFHTSQDEANDWALLKFCAAWMETLIDPVYDTVRDRDDGKPGWAIALDPDNCPASGLPYLACYVGAQLQPGMSEAEKRAEIKEPATWRRGRPESMRTALKPTLTGTQRVIIRERSPEPHDLYVRVLASEAPEPNRTEAIARASKVAGLVLDFEALEGVTWADVAVSWEDWNAVEAAFTSWGDLADILPEELPEP